MTRSSSSSHSSACAASTNSGSRMAGMASKPSNVTISRFSASSVRTLPSSSLGVLSRAADVDVDAIAVAAAVGLGTLADGAAVGVRSASPAQPSAATSAINAKIIAPTVFMVLTTPKIPNSVFLFKTTFAQHYIRCAPSPIGCNNQTPAPYQLPTNNYQLTTNNYQLTTTNPQPTSPTDSRASPPDGAVWARTPPAPPSLSARLRGCRSSSPFGRRAR